MDTMKDIIRSLRLVLSRPAYLFAAVAVSLVFLAVMILLPNLRLVTYVLPSGLFSYTQKIGIIFNLFGMFKTNFTFWSKIAAVIVSLLSGINISLLIFYLSRGPMLGRAAGTGVIGMVSGFLGIGCSACGSVILSSIFGLSAASVFVGRLPLYGYEFNILSIALLLASTSYIAIRIQNPKVCKIKNK